MLHLAIFYTLFSLTCCYALVRGGDPERLIAGIMILGVALTPIVVNPASRRFYGMEAGLLTLDILILLAFVAIALRANRFWPMGIAVFHSMSVVGHLLKLGDPRLIRTAYLVMLALWIYPQMLLLVLGTWRHRARWIATGADRSWSTSSRPSAAARLPSGPNG